MPPSAFTNGFNDVTPKEAATIWRYDPVTGLLYWRESPCNPIPAGAVAGSVSEEGYIRVTYRGKRYMGHWIAWAIVRGEWPTTLLDHANGNGTDNRWLNIRASSATENAANRRRAARHTNLRGARFRKDRGTWIAVFNRVYIGQFGSEQEAHAAWRIAAQAHYGEFARFD